MMETDMSKILQEVQAKASEKGLDLNGYEPHVVQRDSSGMNIIYTPQTGSEEKNVIVSCRITPSGVEILGHNSSSNYGMNKMCRKLGIKMPTC